MAAKLVQPPIPVTQVGPPTPPHIPKMKMMMRAHGTTSATPHINKNNGSRFGDFSSGFRTIRVSDQSFSCFNGEVVEEEETEASDPRTVAQIKAHLYESLQGINRGIFGAPSEKKSEIEVLVNVLESRNPLPEPTLSLDKVAGCWRLVYSTITILGPKRTKLGLRDFISLGDFLQFINLPEEKAVNVVKFNARGLNLFNGQLRIEASFKIASKSVKSRKFMRVDILYEKSMITPEQLMNVFRKNYNLLLDVFNPEGWLEITYVDDTLRIGRDDKGNIFVLERHQVP